MTETAERLSALRNSLPSGVELVAVSKTHPVGLIMEAYDAGQRIFAENKVQEMVLKHDVMPSDIQWHFIGHVQRNKIRLMAPFVSVIQGIDSFQSLAETDRQAARFGRTITCLLQIHIASEETKFGFTPEECTAMLREGSWRDLHNIVIGGVMGMASFTDDRTQVAEEFRDLVEYFNFAKREFFNDSPSFKTISAGMSDDHDIAVEAGSNMVRIGTQIFGHRNYGTVAEKS